MTLQTIPFSELHNMLNPSSKTTDSLTAQVRLAVKNDGRSHKAISTLAGISQPTLSRFMGGKLALTLPMASRILSALGYSVVISQLNSSPTTRCKPGTDSGSRPRPPGKLSSKK